MKRKCTKMVTFDTSSTVTGWAYFENGKLIESGVIDKHKEKDAQIRIEDMSIAIIELLNKYKPLIVAVEEQAFAKSVAAAVMNAKILGVIQGWCLTIGYCEFVALRPSYWRKLVADEGESVPKNRSDAKPWDVVKATKYLGRAPIDDNEADAVLVGFARIKEFCT